MRLFYIFFILYQYWQYCLHNFVKMGWELTHESGKIMLYKKRFYIEHQWMRKFIRIHLEYVSTWEIFWRRLPWKKPCQFMVIMLFAPTMGAHPSHSANTKWPPSVGLMLAHRLRRWANINPTLGGCLVFAGPAGGNRASRRVRNSNSGTFYVK